MAQVKMPRRPNIGWGMLLLCLLVFLLVVVYVAATLLGGYVFNPAVGAFGADLPPIVYAVAVAFLAYKVQQKLSEAYGAQRIVEATVSVILLGIVLLSLANWMHLPFATRIASRGLQVLDMPLATQVTSHMLGVAAIFGVLALWDVIIRDFLGLGRRSGANRWSRYFGMNRDDLVSGRYGDLPDATEELASRTGSPLFRAKGTAVIDLDWFVRHPVTGDFVPVSNVPARLAIRAIDHMADGSSAVGSDVPHVVDFDTPHEGSRT